MGSQARACSPRAARTLQAAEVQISANSETVDLEDDAPTHGKLLKFRARRACSRKTVMKAPQLRFFLPQHAQTVRLATATCHVFRIAEFVTGASAADRFVEPGQRARRVQHVLR